MLKFSRPRSDYVSVFSTDFQYRHVSFGILYYLCYQGEIPNLPTYAVAIAYVTASGLSRSCGTSERLYLISYSSTVQVCCQ
jgi:hypothetical protein